MSNQQKATQGTIDRAMARYQKIADSLWALHSRQGYVTVFDVERVADVSVGREYVLRMKKYNIKTPYIYNKIELRLFKQSRALKQFMSDNQLSVITLAQAAKVLGISNQATSAAIGRMKDKGFFTPPIKWAKKLDSAPLKASRSRDKQLNVTPEPYRLGGLAVMEKPEANKWVMCR